MRRGGGGVQFQSKVVARQWAGVCVCARARARAQSLILD